MSQDYGTEEDGIICRETLLPAFSRDAFAYVVATVLPTFVSVVLMAIGTRIFPPREFGQYSLAVATVTICGSLLSGWIQHSILRFRPLYVERNAQGDFNRNLVLLLGVLTLVTAGAGLVGWPILRPILGSYRRLYALGVGLLMSGLWMSSFGSMLQSDLRSRKYSIFQTAQSVLRLAVSLMWVFLIARDVAGFLWGVLLVQVLAIVPMSVTLGLHRIRFARAASEQPFIRFTGHFLRYGVPIVGWIVGSQLLDVSDRYLLQVFRGSAEVGIYTPVAGVARALIALATAPLIMAARALLMKEAGGEALDTPRLQGLVSELSRIFLLIAIPTAAFVMVFGRQIVTLFLGPDYREGFTIIPLIATGFVAWRFTMYGHKGFEFLKQTKNMFAYVMVCASTNVLLNLYFIPQYGYRGAAVTTLISSLLYPVLVYFGSRRAFAWRIPWASVSRIVLCGSVAGGCAYGVRWAVGSISSILLLAIGFGVLSMVYVLALLAMKEVSWDELRLLRRAIGGPR